MVAHVDDWPSEDTAGVVRQLLGLGSPGLALDVAPAGATPAGQNTLPGADAPQQATKHPPTPAAVWQSRACARTRPRIRRP
jgi:hypothetical protein